VLVGREQWREQWRELLRKGEEEEGGREELLEEEDWRLSSLSSAVLDTAEVDAAVIDAESTALLVPVFDNASAFFHVVVGV